MQITTRADAILAGVTTYFTGKPCKYGHVCQRLTYNCNCAECALTHQARYFADPANKVKHRNRVRRWNNNNPELLLAISRKSRGLPTPTREPPEACECCGRHISKFKRGFSLDHCHVTGAFRGWLCGNCNTAIGKLGDSAEGIRKALRYLEQHPVSST